MSTATVDSELPALEDINASSRPGAYVGGLWSRRSYIWYVSASELRSQQINTVLGNLWHLLNPALSIAIYYVIFGLLLGTSRGVDNFILFLTIGIFIFQYTQRATTQGATAITQNAGLLKAIRFPRALLPVTSTLTETLSSLPTFVIIYVVALLTGQDVRWQWALMPLVLVGQLLFNLGAAMVAAPATTHFRDMTQLLPFFFRLLLYASGVIFLASAYAESRYAWLFTANPMYCFITITRWCVMGEALDGTVVISALLWTIGLLVGGFLWFRAGEERYGRDSRVPPASRTRCRQRVGARPSTSSTRSTRIRCSAPGTSSAAASGRERPSIVHAVKSLSFDMHMGEAVGIVGSNGSGKSTLLRAIAGLQSPAGGTGVRARRATPVGGGGRL